MKSSALCLVLGISWLALGLAQGGTDAAPSAPPPDFWTQPNLTGNWGGLRDKLHEDGTDFLIQDTGEALGNPYGGNRGQGAIYESLLNTQVTLDFDKMTGDAWKGATFCVSSYWTEGPSLTRQNVGDYSVLSGIDAHDTVRLENLWLQQNFLENKISLKVGQLSIDSEFFISPSAQLFVNSTFGAPPLVAYNFQSDSAPVYPLSTTGAGLKIQPADSFYLMTGVYDGSAGTETGDNQNGTRFGFSAATGILSFSEIGYLLNQEKDAKGLPGTYKLDGWVHTANFTTYASQGAFAKGTGPLQSSGVNYGIYGVADQVIWQRAVAASQTQSLALFLRVGGAPSRSSQVDFDIDGGLDFTGLIPGRKDDIFGLGFARSDVSHDYSNYSQAIGGPAFRAETLLEGTYSLNLAPWWQVQPDLQYIFAAGATTTSPDALVVGVRSIITF